MVASIPVQAFVLFPVPENVPLMFIKETLKMKNLIWNKLLLFISSSLVHRVKKQSSKNRKPSFTFICFSFRHESLLFLHPWTPKLLHCFYRVHSNLRNHFCLWPMVYQSCASHLPLSQFSWQISAGIFPALTFFSLFVYSLFIFLGNCLLLYFISGRSWVLSLLAVVTFPCHTDHPEVCLRIYNY